ncbi:MAG TPA: class II fructose-bisphosphatase [Methylomirabilota bacterium]|nr:class II fructose-bisphosphatase [Methylomirabilota bacterium]
MTDTNQSRNLALEFVRVTEAAAIAASAWIGRGDKHAADNASVNAMRSRLNQIDFQGTIVIGEGEKDKAPLLYTGEKVGKGKTPKIDIAVDPLECTDSVAYGRYNAMTVIAAGPKGSLLHAPDMYMQKIAAGPLACQVIDLDAPVTTTISKVAKALGKDKRELIVIVLDRKRHQTLIEEIRKTGARLRLITDGDVAGAIAPSLEENDADLLLGIGASTEAVLAASAIKVLGGQILARFAPQNDADKKRLHAAGITKIDKIFAAEDLARGKDLTFTATGVIDGPLLKGVVDKGNKIVTHSLVLRGISGTMRYMTTHHHYHQL